VVGNISNQEGGVGRGVVFRESDISWYANALKRKNSSEGGEKGFVNRKKGTGREILSIVAKASSLGNTETQREEPQRILSGGLR